MRVLLLIALVACIAMTATTVSADTCPTKFYWATGPWSTCGIWGTQCAFTQTRDIFCRCGSTSVPFINCAPIPGGEPATSRTCGDNGGGSFYWATTAWSDGCTLPGTATCGIGANTRTALCKCGQTIVANVYCANSPGGIPKQTRECSVPCQ